MTEFVLNIAPDQKINNSKLIWEHFRELNPGKYLVKITSVKTRSIKQNSYLHGCVFPMVMEGLRNIGWDDVKDEEDAKLICKELFLKRKIENKHTGEIITIIKKTSDLTTIEMGEFIEDIIKWGAEYLSVTIPYPNEPIPMFTNE